MRKLFVALLIGALCAVVGCSGSQVAVSGTVRGMQENTVIVGAKITAVGKDTHTTVTGPDGTYKLMLTPGTYEFTVTYPTFNPASATVPVKEEPITKDFSLSTGLKTTMDFPEQFQCNFTISTRPNASGARSLVTRDGHVTALEFGAAKNTNGDAPEGYSYELGIYASILFTAPGSYQGYRLYSSPSADGPFILVNTGDVYCENKWATFGCNFSDPHYFSADGCYYALQLYAEEGETPLTEPVQLVPLEPLTLIAPANNAELTVNSVTLEWNPVAECNGYGMDIYRKTDSEYNPWVLFDHAIALPVPEAVFSDLPQGKYCWYVWGSKNTSTNVGFATQYTYSAYRFFSVE